VLRLGEMSIEGYSVAGEETWFRIHPPGIALDVGRGAPTLTGSRDLFVSHGHLDHALGIPYVLSQRTMHHVAPADPESVSRPVTRIFCPRAIAEGVAALVLACERLESVAYRHEIVGLDPGDRVDVGRGLAIEAFSTDHVVPSLGFHLLRRRRKLEEEYRSLSRDELVRLKASGVGIERESEEIWLSYCGDTGPGVWRLAPRLAESRLLMIECTFLGDEARQRGTAYKHLHFEDLVDHEADLAGHEAIVLHHLSRRHTLGDLRREVETRLPRLAPKVHLLGAAS
jgi:ribonuclease Z